MSRKWSRTIPRKEGWYYIHRKWVNGSSTYCDHVMIDKSGHAFYDRETPYDGTESLLFKDQQDRFWFIGPIEFPGDPDG